jgi:hypothetical protein
MSGFSASALKNIMASKRFDFPTPFGACHAGERPKAHVNVNKIFETGNFHSGDHACTLKAWNNRIRKFCIKEFW